MVNITNDTYYSNSTNSTITIIDDTYHTQYLSLLIITMILFFGFSYYLYYTAKHGIKNARNSNSETSALHSKYEIIKSFSTVYAIRAVSIVYILICFNKSGNDFISFVNYVMHIVPSLLFISIFYSYIRFLIEKYYEIITKKKDIFFTPTFHLFNIIVYATTLIIFIICLTIKNYSGFNFLSMSLVCILSLILSILYLFYGLKLASIYSVKNQNKESFEMKEKMLIRNRILFISLVVGILYLGRAVLSFYICINVYNGSNFLNMNPNLSDCISFILNELLCSLLVAFSRYRQDQIRSVDKFNFEKHDIGPNYNMNEIDLNMELNNTELNDFLIDNKDINIMKD